MSDEIKTNKSMTGKDIALLLTKIGPIALDWLVELGIIWNKEMTPEELEAFVKGKRKSYDDYIAAERASRISV